MLFKQPGLRGFFRAPIVLLAVFPLLVTAEEVITIEGTRIRGNQELPTILYLIPWQAPEVEALDAPASSLAIERPIQILERSEFKRLVGYHEHFKQVSTPPELPK